MQPRRSKPRIDSGCKHSFHKERKTLRYTILTTTNYKHGTGRRDKDFEADVVYIKEVLAELVEDSRLTSEEEKLVRDAKGAVGRHNLSEFMKAEEL